MTLYCDPKTVQGPKKSVSNVQVVYDGGADDCAVATLVWEGRPGVGIRWNGNIQDQPLGNPQSRGHPMWLLVPPDFADLVLQRALELAPESELDAAYRNMSTDSVREQDATVWADALIGDVNDPPR